eukprot:6767551-Prorocentrum_lima.AAC.1
MTSSLVGSEMCIRDRVCRLRHHLRDSHLHFSTKVFLLKAIIVSRLLYGAESWPPLGPGADMQLQHVIVRALRHCRPSWSLLAPTAVTDLE